MGHESGTRLPIVPILIINFIGTLGFSIVLPFLVYLVTGWGGNAFVYGVTSATYSAFQLIGAPILGRWSDTHGRKKILILSQAGTLVSWMILLVAFFVPRTTILAIDNPVTGSFVLTIPLAILIAARALDGLTGGNVSVANAYLADISPDNQRTANFGKLAISSNLGFVLGPAIAGLLGATIWGERLPVIAAMLISLVATILIAVRLQESRAPEIKHDPASEGIRTVSAPERYEPPGIQLDIRGILALPDVAFMLVIYFIVMLGFSFFYAGFPVWAVRGLEWTVTETGIFFSFLSLLMVLTQGPLLSFLAGRFNEARLSFVGSIFLGSSFLLIGSRESSVVYVGAALLALGNGIMWPSVLSLLSRAAGTEHQGAVQGFAGSAGAVASIIGLLTGGLLFEVLESSLFLASSGMIFLTTILCMSAHRIPNRRGEELH